MKIIDQPITLTSLVAKGKKFFDPVLPEAGKDLSF